MLFHLPSLKLYVVCYDGLASKIRYKIYIALVYFGKTFKDSNGHDNAMGSCYYFIKVNPITQEARFVERFSKCNKTQKLQINTTFIQIGRL
jgi:hypothetical protein